MSEQIEISKHIIERSKKEDFQILPSPDIVGFPDYYYYNNYVIWLGDWVRSR